MHTLSRKNNLAKHLMKMRKKFPQEYKFAPLTWILPFELGELRTQDNKDIYIVKPEASCQGKGTSPLTYRLGIYLTKNIDSLKDQDHSIVQKYLLKPYLIDKLKFDIRLYVLLTGCDPLR